MKIRFLGATREVTGSCFLLEINELRVLVECGLHQGEANHEENRKPFDFDPREIDYVFITHAHLDHSGLLPKLVKEGFSGKIIMTPATRDLLELLLFDAAHIQETDSEWATRKALRRGKPPVEPLYTVEDVRRVLPLIEPVPYDRVFHLGHGIRFRFLDAGHILGSGTLEVWYRDSPEEKKIIFSGDIGKKGSPIIKDPETSKEADYIVMEATYGERLHKPFDESVNELIEAIKTTFKRGGNVYIPSYAVGRTQDLLYILNNLVRQGRLYRINVYLDSPLAEEATKVYLRHPECFDEEAMKLFTAKSMGDSMVLHFVKRTEDSMALNRIRAGIIVIAGSGMCEGGRIRHHLKHNLWRPECSVIFVGFQAKGTLGRRIIEGEQTVNILGEEVAVRASIYTINGFSAHADRKGLLEWLENFADTPHLFLVHGEEESLNSFRDAVRERFGFGVTIPERGQEFYI